MPGSRVRASPGPQGERYLPCRGLAYGRDGRIYLTGLDAISNDDELQAEPLFNDGYAAPEIYKGRKIDKRADIFSLGALLYTCLTGERLEAESWRGEAGSIRFYPPHVVAPAIEQAVRRALVFDPAGRWPNVDAFKAELVRINSSVTIRASLLTDVGMVRELNEDAVIAAEYRRDSQVEPAQNLLYVIADGMGGAEAGEIASAIAVGAIRTMSSIALPLASRLTRDRFSRTRWKTRIRGFSPIRRITPKRGGWGPRP